MALMVASGYSVDDMVAAMTERTPEGKIILAKFMDVPQSFSDETVRESLIFAFFEHFLDILLPLDTADQLDESVMHKILQHQALLTTFLKNHDHFIVRTHPDVVCHLSVGVLIRLNSI